MSQQVKEKYLIAKGYCQTRSIEQIEKFLTSTGAICKDILEYKDIEGRSLIFHAVFHPNENFAVQLADMLIRMGADPKDKQINKQTVLYYIAKDGRLKLLNKFLSFGFNLNENDYMNQTPLFYAAKHNHLQVAKRLIQYGCEVNHKDSNHQTCLYYAAGAGNLQICQMLANKGCNVLHQDKNRVKASHFAKINGHKQVVQYLNQFKYEAKRNKQEKIIKQSSQNEKKKKKQQVKSEYCLVYCNENGQTIQLTVEQLKQFAEACPQNRSILQMLINSQNQETQPQMNVPQKKFQKIALKILNHIWKLQHSHHFYDPVDYVRHKLMNYREIVKYPMDLGTIKKKLTYNAYQGEDQFKNDMNLVFDNCILYNGMQSPYGKIAMEIKLQFNNMYMKELHML